MTFDHSKPLSNHLRRKGNNESVYSRLQSQPCTEEVLLAEGHLLQGGGAHTVGGDGGRIWARGRGSSIHMFLCCHYYTCVLQLLIAVCLSVMILLIAAVSIMLGCLNTNTR